MGWGAQRYEQYFPFSQQDDSNEVRLAVSTGRFCFSVELAREDIGIALFGMGRQVVECCVSMEIGALLSPDGLLKAHPLLEIKW